jgi:hypothetical protein
MGGALATFATYLALFDGCNEIPGWARGTAIDFNDACMNSYIPVEALYTFGQPMNADLPFATAMGRRLDATHTAYFRFANADDGVPAFPDKVSFAHISHEGNANDYIVGLTRAGRLTLGKDPKGVDDRAPGAADEKCGDRSGNDHSLTTYAAKIRAYAKGTQWQPTLKCQ